MSFISRWRFHTTRLGQACGLFLFASLSACLVNLVPPKDALISCASNVDCPPDDVCSQTLLLCVSRGDVGLPPTVTAASVTPTYAKAGTVVVASFTPSTALGGDPSVVI